MRGTIELKADAFFFSISCAYQKSQIREWRSQDDDDYPCIKHTPATKRLTCSNSLHRMGAIARIYGRELSCSMARNTAMANGSGRIR